MTPSSPSRARIEALYLKTAKRGPMAPVERMALVRGRGIAGNANQGGRRQVTILERERWEAAMRDLGADAPAHARRANVLVSGVRLADARGRTIRLGTARIRILGETKPCPRMDEAVPGLQDALRPGWGGGAYGEVLDDAPITIGDAVAWDDDVDDAGRDGGAD